MLQPVINSAPPVQTETAGAPTPDAAEAGTAFGLVLGAIQSVQAETSPAREAAAPPASTDTAAPSLLDSTLGAAVAMLFQAPPAAVAQAGSDPATVLAETGNSEPGDAGQTMPPQQNLPLGPADLAGLGAYLPTLNPLASNPSGQPASITVQLSMGVAGLASGARAASAAAPVPVTTSTATTATAESATATTATATVDAANGTPTRPAAVLAGLLGSTTEGTPAKELVQSDMPSPAKPVLATPAPLLVPAEPGLETARQATTDIETELLGKPIDLLANRVLTTLSEMPPTVGRPAAPTSQVLPVGDSATPSSPGALAGQTQPASDTAQSASRVVSHVAAPLLSREWRSELSDRVAWMVGRQAQSAEIILNPPALGSIEVRLNMNLAGNEAGAQFFSANANVRDALESAFPRLRELMANMGITLGEASVSSQSFGERQEWPASGQASGNTAASTAFGAAAPGALLSGAVRSQGLVDLYI